MLREALERHEQQTAKPEKRTLEELFSSSPVAPSSSASQNNNPAYKNPLKPTTASLLNRAQSMQHGGRSNIGVKRMANGLAKAIDGSFDEELGSRHKPITISDAQGKPQATFDPDDFDSDVDLDVEEPVARASSSYPKLPRQPSPVPSPPPKPVVYPTLARQAQVQPSFIKDAETVDPGCGAILPAASPTEQSSQPLSWSSSSDDFYTSTRPQTFLEYLHDPSCILQRRPNNAPVQKETKRRKLPWQSQSKPPVEEDSITPCSTTGPMSANVSTSIQATPAPNASKSASYPWNTTASAVKEQQKQLREQSRKRAVKEHEATEENIRKAKSTQTRPAKVFLSEEQQHVLDLVTEQRKSVFFTGSAGTGKSVLLREIIATLRKKHQREPDRVAVTASTGLAACNIGGVTLHSFAGIGLGKEDAPELVRKIKKNQKAKLRWMRTKVLIIDEISMVDADLFDKLESVARQMRNNGRPFGGIQLVITGDFFQLPPVPDSGRAAKFAFDAATWNTTIEHTIGLHHVFRQKDPIFAGMLNEMREGRLTESSIKAFRNLNRAIEFKDHVEATELFPTRAEVDRANQERLQHLEGRAQIYEARDSGAITDKAQRDKLLQNCMAPEIITLKKGAQVMLIKNVDESLVNGSIGRVIGFMSEQTFDSYQANDEAFCASPGGTLASSSDPHLTANQKTMVHIANGGISTSRLFPVVRFIIADGTTRDLLCQPESWKVELPNGEVQASRSQVPLILAWALSIHKAQGQTLQRVKVDLGKVFEKGQAYVALSRATSMAGLQVLRFDPKKVVAHEKVRAFYSNLSRVELAEKNKERLEGKREDGKVKKGKPGVGVKAEAYESMYVNDELSS